MAVLELSASAFRQIGNGSFPPNPAVHPGRSERRVAILEKMQQIVNERTMFAPIWQLAFINGHGPRVGESGFGLIPGFAYTGPYEDITLKSG
jgi:hypothetical protein